MIDDDDESDIQTITPRRLLTPRSAKGKEVAVASESDEDITPRVRRIRSDVKEDDESDAAGPESKRRRRSTQTQARLSGMGSKWASRTDVQNDRTDTQMTDTDDTQMMLRPPDKDGSEESDGLEILSPTRRKPAEGSEKGEEEETGLGSDYELALKTSRNDKLH